MRAIFVTFFFFPLLVFLGMVLAALRVHCSIPMYFVCYVWGLIVHVFAKLLICQSEIVLSMVYVQYAMAQQHMFIGGTMLTACAMALHYAAVGVKSITFSTSFEVYYSTRVF